MLHQDLVSILRLRNQDDAHKRAAAKWRARWRSSTGS